jgi:hypothetical protein
MMPPSLLRSEGRMRRPGRRQRAIPLLQGSQRRRLPASTIDGKPYQARVSTDFTHPWSSSNWVSAEAENPTLKSSPQSHSSKPSAVFRINATSVREYVYQRRFLLKAMQDVDRKQVWFEILVFRAAGSGSRDESNCDQKVSVSRRAHVMARERVANLID